MKPLQVRNFLVLEQKAVNCVKIELSYNDFVNMKMGDVWEYLRGEYTNKQNPVKDEWWYKRYEPIEDEL